jgi:agmatinase
MSQRCKPPRLAFAGATHVAGPKGCHAVLFGAPHGTPYPLINNRVHEEAPEALRSAMSEDTRWINHWDFDLGGTLDGGGDFRFGDMGDLRTLPDDGPGNRALIHETTCEILGAGAVPIMIGGDDSTPIPFIEAFSKHGPLTILQIDAHIDLREERRDERYGFSSTMRRASEMGHVESIIHAGTRGLGSAREADVMAARNWGAHIITARQILADGVAPVLNLIPKGANVLITFDCDALDGSIMPAVISPTPGGLTYWHILDLIAGVSQRGRIAGMDLIEFVPERDHANQSAAYLASRILVFTAGTIARTV